MPQEPIVRVIGEEEDRTVPVEGDILTIGRARDNDLVLEESSCSRSHCRIEQGRNGYKLVDLESRNGTKVNGHFTNKHLLKDSDRIEIGNTLLIFEMPEGGASVDLAPDETPVEGGGSKSGSAGKKGSSSKRTSKSKKSSSRGRSSSRSSMSASTLVLLTIVGSMVVLAMILLANRQDPGVVASRKSFQRGEQALQEKRYEDAISNFERVSREKTPDLYSKAQQKLKKARNMKRRQARRRILSKARREFRDLKQRLEEEKKTPDEIKKKLEDFRQEVRSRFTPRQRKHSEVESFLDRVRSAEDEVFSKNPEVLEQKWNQVKKNVNQYIEQDKFGLAARKIGNFIERYGDTDTGGKAKNWRNHMTKRVEAYVERTIRQSVELQKNGKIKIARNKLQRALKNLESGEDGFLSDYRKRLRGRLENLEKSLDSD